MKSQFSISCHTVMDIIYESDNNSSLSLFTQLKLKLHLLFCPDCTGELRVLQHAKKIMENDFFPQSPHLESLLMEYVLEEEGFDETNDAPLGFSLKGWVIIGFFVLLSLVSSIFGINFIKIAASEGLSFLLPFGLTIGMVVTCYGALFIGSHLKELSTWFRLR